jgi:segregation and condensation protein B
METLSIIAYHQPVTRAEVEDIRGVTLSKGTLDILLEIGWIRMRGRKRVPGRPVTYGTTDEFLMHFGLDKVSDLPGLEELRAAGLLEGKIPASFMVPSPSDSLSMEEDPLEADDEGETFEQEALDPKDGG